MFALLIVRIVPTAAWSQDQGFANLGGYAGGSVVPRFTLDGETFDDPHPRIGIVLGYGYRPIWFHRVTGITDTRYDLRPRFRESSKGPVFTTLFTF